MTTGGVSYEITGTLVKQNGSAMVTIDRMTGDGSAVMFSTGWCNNETEANEMAQYILNLGDSEIMKLLKDDKLFPHIKGAMIREKNVTLHLSGKAQRIEIKSRERGGGDPTYKTELWFTDRKKTAIITANETMKLIEVYDGEDDTDMWHGFPCVLTGEEGNWGGVRQWALRINKDETEKEYRKFKSAKNKAQKKEDNAELEPLITFEKEIDESDLVDLDEFDDVATNLELFGDGETGGTPHNYSEA